MTGFSVDKDGKQTGGLEQWATSLGKMVGSVKGLWQQLETGKKKFDAMNVAAGKSKSSFSDYIKYISESEDATEAFGLATLYTRARVLLLNMALSTGLALAASLIVKKIAEASQSIETNATKSKEAADAAQSTTSSLKDLVSAYEELGDKSGWDTDDFDQAKDIQEEILQLAKEQGTLDEDKVGKLNLQNGKYQEQLGLLQDITAEQLEASRYELTQNKDAQGDKLVNTAKKNNRTHYLTVWSIPEMDMGDQIKNAGIDVFNKFGGYGPDDLNDADSVVDYYNEVGKALKYVIDNTTEAERAAGGTYHSLYKFLLDEQSALRDDVNSYNDSTDAINNNTNARRKLQAVDFWQNDNNNSMDVSFTFDKVNSAVQTLEDTIDGFDASKLNELLWGTNEGLSDEQAQALANLRKALTDMDFSADTNGVNAFIQALVQVGIVAQSSANDVDAVAQASQKMEDISSKIDEIQTAYKNATTAIEEYNKYGYLSADTLQTLLNEDFEYLSCLELVDGQLQVNTEKYQGMIAAQYQSAAMALVEKANAELAKIAQGEKKDAVEDATKATEDQATALTERVCPALGEFAKASMTAAAAQEFLANGDAAWSVDPERTKEVYAGLASGLDILDATVDQIMGNSDKFRQHMNGFDKETKNRNKNTAKSVTDVASAFDTLNKAMKEYNQYGYLCADTAKSLIGLDDKFTACLTKQGDKLQINVEQFRKFVKEQLKEANAAKDGGKSADEMNKILNYLDQNVDTTTISFEQLTDAIKGYGTAMDEAKEKTDAIKSAFSGLKDVIKTLGDSQFGIADADSIDKQADAIRNLVTQYKDYPDLLNNIVDENGKINLNTDAFKNALVKTLEDLANTAKETGGAGADALYNVYHSASQNISQGKITPTDWVSGLGTDLSNANDALDRYQSNWGTLKDAMDEWNETGQLTQDTMQKLMALPDEFSSLLGYDEDGNAKLDVKTLRDNYVKQLEELAKEFKGKPIGIQAEAAIEDVREPTPEEYEKLAKKTLTYQKALKKYTDKLAKIDSNKNLTEDDALQQKAEAQAELDGALQDSLKEVQETDAQVTAKLEKHWDGVKTVIENFKNALSDAKDVLNSFLSLIEKFNTNKDNDLKLWGEAMTEDIDKRIDALNKQKEALEKANDEEERAITLAKLKAELEKARTQRTVRKYTSNGYEWVADASAVKEAQDNLNDQQRTWRKEDAEKAIDDQIDKLNELKDKYSEIINLIGTSWDDYNKKLKYSAEIADMTFTEMEGRLDIFKGNVLGAMQSTKATSGIQDVISKLESLITTLEKVNNLYSWAESGFTDYTDKGFNGLIKTAKKIFGSTGPDGKLNISISTGLKNIGKTVKNAFSGTSGNSITKAFQAGWEAISSGAKGLFSGSGANSLTTIFSNGLSGIGDLIGSAFKGLGSTFASGGQILVKAAGNVATKIGSALGIGGVTAAGGASAIPVVGAIVAGVVNGINTNIRLIKNQKEIWSSDDKVGVKIAKSVGNVIWRYSPIGMIASTIQNISGFVKKIFGIESKKDKNNGTSSNGKIDVGSIVINSPDSPASNANSGTSGSDTGTTKQSLWDRIKNSKLWFWNWGKRAVGDKGVKHSGMYNIDEQGPELLVRQPASGRYTYLETGDGVVPADITSKLFEMGGNTDKWFANQLSKNSVLNTIQNKTIGYTVSVGDIYIQNPVGDTDALAREIVRDLPIKLRQQQGRR